MNESFGSNLAKAVITRIAIFILAISVLSLCHSIKVAFRNNQQRRAILKAGEDGKNALIALHSEIEQSTKVYYSLDFANQLKFKKELLEKYTAIAKCMPEPSLSALYLSSVKELLDLAFID